MTAWINAHPYITVAIWVLVMIVPWCALLVWINRGKAPATFHDEHEDAGVG